ncbi:hypothetical protein ADN00_13005 [Ornatilinea apprima]|uniref:CRISPR type III-associated protein domain-containing protein n=1 Tax=Ornatilinea apprima TaxID=1134406 RepID=A0A0P6X5J6_9CHLR|nr:RAMP superfamily CRISPR-associated protein [Ornatilinea apprima]KPL75304.1 hypothetical protein ADN00_13005 [Ornatilinea apprima]
MTYILPYNFVRLQPIPAGDRKKPTSHGNPDPDQELHSGRLTCRIICISPIFILPTNHTRSVSLGWDDNGNLGSHNIYEQFFCLKNDFPVIPASSIKGSIRLVAEALCNGCMSTFAESYESSRDHTHRYHLTSNSIYSCSEPFNLCPTCRIFGMATESQQNNQTKSNEKLFYRGKLEFSHARLAAIKVDYFEDPIMLPVMGNPRADVAVKVYGDNIGNARGRKFYYHRHDLQIIPSPNGYDTLKRWEQTKQPRNIRGFRWNMRPTIRPLHAGSIFEFDVEYQSLEKEELDLLITALELFPNLIDDQGKSIVPDSTMKFNEDYFVGEGVYHKFGYGKPAGLGSAACYITHWRVLHLQNRYQASPAVDGGWVEVQNLRQAVEDHKNKFKNVHGSQTYFKDLMAILRYPHGITKMQHIEQGDPAEQHLPPVPGKEKEWLKEQEK